MRGADGKPAVCEGARDDNPTKDGGKIGPEFTFGLTMDAALAEPVLIIKTEWGGKSLHTDFRPPSAGPYELNDYKKKLYYGPPGTHFAEANLAMMRAAPISPSKNPAKK